MTRTPACPATALAMALVLAAPAAVVAQDFTQGPVVARHECHPDGEGGCGAGGGSGASLPSEGAADCVGGTAGSFECNNVDLEHWLDIADIGGGEGNDCWGWTDTGTSDEYAIMGRTNGTSFIDISDPENPVYLGNLPPHDTSSTWRDIKVYADHAFIVSESNNHGMQVFDLTQLAAVASPPVTFAETAHYAGFDNAHNIAINEATGYAYVVGSDQCSGGLEMIDISTPTAPTFAGCFADDGYTHDVQCVVYAGPDTEHAGKEICFAANENALTIVDVTNKGAPVQLATTDHAGRAYTHQCWLTDDHAHLLVDDEFDEVVNGHNTRTYIVDLADLDAPVFTSTYTSHLGSRDHNQYVLGDYAFQANYTAGLRILDLSNIAGGALCEVASFDAYPFGNATGFDGAWSNYPYFPSGTAIVSVSNGLAIVRPNHVGQPCIPPVPIAQDGAQQRCINAMNKAGAKVAKAQGKLDARCVKEAGKGSIVDAQACIEDDEDGKVAKAGSKTQSAFDKKCSLFNAPDFGLTSVAAMNDAASNETIALMADLYGPDLEAAMIDAATDPAGARCQADVTKLADRVAQAARKAFLTCKKAGLKNGTIGSAATLATDCFTAVDADAKGKIAAATSKLDTAIALKCSGVDLDQAFPASCFGTGAGALAACIGEQVDCRVCRILNAGDGLTHDCDLFDDGITNSSCLP